MTGGQISRSRGCLLCFDCIRIQHPDNLIGNQGDNEVNSIFRCDSEPVPMSSHIKYRQLKAFVLVVELGSFKAAADRLAVSQPSLSAMITDLEQDLRVGLLD